MRDMRGAHDTTRDMRERTIPRVTWERTTPRVIWGERTIPRVTWGERTIPRVTWGERTTPRVTWGERTTPRVTWGERTTARVTWGERTTAHSVVGSCSASPGGGGNGGPSVRLYCIGYGLALGCALVLFPGSPPPPSHAAYALHPRSLDCRQGTPPPIARNSSAVQCVLHGSTAPRQRAPSALRTRSAHLRPWPRPRSCGRRSSARSCRAACS